MELFPRPISGGQCALGQRFNASQHGGHNVFYLCVLSLYSIFFRCHFIRIAVSVL